MKNLILVKHHVRRKQFISTLLKKKLINKSKRIIQDLDCYYNLQNIQSTTEDTEFELYSTLFSDRSIFTPVDSTIELIQNITFINKQQPCENKIININNESRSKTIQNNIVNKRKTIYYLSTIAKNSVRNVLDSESSTTEKNSILILFKINLLKNLFFIIYFQADLQQESIQKSFVNDKNNQINYDSSSSLTPKFCIYCCHNCRAIKNFSIQDLKKPNFIHQSKINDELHLHGHKKSLLMPKTKKFRTVSQAKEELIAHYEAFHKQNLKILKK